MPVISRREYVDGQLIRLHLILISVPSETYRTFYYNELQTGPMPSTWRDLLVVFDMARYLRWSVLEPCRESIRRSPGPHLSVEDRAACGDMLKSIEQMSLEAGTWNFKGLDRLASLFPVPQRDWIAAAVQRWAVAVVQLKRDIEASVKTKALRAIEELLLVNGQFLVFAARQFASSLQAYIHSVYRMASHNFEEKASRAEDECCGSEEIYPWWIREDLAQIFHEGLGMMTS